MQTADTENRDWKSVPTDYTNQLGLRKAQKAEKKKKKKKKESTSFIN